MEIFVLPKDGNNQFIKMKNVFFSLALMLIGSFAFANNQNPSTVKSVEAKILPIKILNLNSLENKVGRQCCTKTTFMADGSSVSITACAGWFLSDDANAMTRACAKVDEAMGN